MARTTEQLGGKIGPRIAKIVTDAHAQATSKAGPHRIRQAMALQEAFFSLTGAEVRSTIGPIVARLADDPDTPEEYRKAFHFLAYGHGQWQTMLAHAVAGQALTVGFSGLINNAMAPVIGKIISEKPQGNLDAGTYAAGVAAGHIRHDEGARGAAFDGVRNVYFDLLVELAETQLPAGTVLDLLNRGEIDHDTAVRSLRYAGMAPDRAEAFIKTRHQILSPAVAADAVIRGILTPGEGARIAERNGMSEADFVTLTLDTGEAPAPATLLEAYRRGIVGTDRLEHGIRQGRTRNEWIDVIEALRYTPPSPADAIRGAVQNHLPLGKARTLAEEAGLDPQHFQWLYDTAGEPIATGEAIQLWRRGEMTQAEVEQVIRESRTKVKYVPAMLKLRRHLLPERTVVSAVRQGAMTPAQATAELVDLGVDPVDIAVLLKEASNTKTAHQKNLSESMLVELYEAGAVDEAHTLDALHALGYDPHEAEQILALADLRAERKLQTSVANVIRARYVSRHIDEATASSALDSARISHVERNKLLALWTLERDTTTRLPTVAELTSAVKKAVITPVAWAGRLVELGYAEDDIGIMAAAHNVNLGG